ncbi:MAG TPA: hypothetical protein ENF81_05210 [Thermotogaceae bacterium]|nr:hypothetical protein [Thermotogaceae bacterium]
MIAVGAFLSISGFLKSEFVIYKVLAARSKILWGENVHIFYAVVGILVAIVGILFAVDVFK